MTGAAALVVAVAMGLLMAHAAWTDIGTRRIANGTSLAIAALLPVRALLAPDPFAFVGHLGAGLAVFVAGYGLWSARLIGGGDVKLAAALAAHVCLAKLGAFLLLTSLAGGLLAIACLVAGFLDKKAGPVAAGQISEPPESAAVRTFPTVPYGVAIVGGAAVSMLTG